jgi:phage-related protein
MKGGSVEFNFTGNTKDIEKKASGLGNKLKGLASAGGKALLGMTTAAGTALVGLTSKVVGLRGEVEQQIGGTEAVFGDLAKVVQEKAGKAFDKMGVSASEYMANMNKMASLMKGSGIATQKAMDLSSEAMQRAADVASIMGISVDDAMVAIQGAAKGNFTMMDNLGVAMNATSLNAYALSKGLKKTYQQMSQGEKVELAMQMFLEKSAYAAGNYAKENDTFAGSLNTVKAAAQNLLAGTGNVQSVITALSNFGKILSQQLITILPDLVQGIVGLIQGLLPLIPPLIQAVLPALIQGIMQLTIALIELLPEIITMFADMLPTLMPQIVEAIMTIIPALIKNIPLFLQAGLKLVGGIVKGIILGVAQLIKSIVDLAKKAIAKLKEKFSGKSILEIGKDLVKGLWNGISNATDWVLDKIKGFGKSILKGIKGIFGISSPSKEFEIIGKYNVMGLEEGMEKENLKLQSSFDDMFKLSPNLYGTSSTNLSPQINVYNNISMKQDSLGQMVNDIKTFSGGAKNDYSYGMGA